MTYRCLLTQSLDYLLMTTALCINENSSENLEILANQELKNIYLWMVSNGLTFYPSKTQALSIAPFIHKSSPSLSLNLCNC